MFYLQCTYKILLSLARIILRILLRLYLGAIKQLGLNCARTDRNLIKKYTRCR